MYHVKTFGLSLALLLVLGCSPSQEEAVTANAGAVAAETQMQTKTDPAALAVLDAAVLHERAAQALREKRTYAPAGRNAVEYYLALRDKALDQARIQSALVELQPYVVIASEQAIAGERFDEARRLIALLTRMDGTALALPRLQRHLDATEATRAAAEQQALQDAERRAAAVEPPAAPQAVQRAAQQAALEAERATVARMVSSGRRPADTPTVGRTTATPASTGTAPARETPATARSRSTATPPATRVAARPTPPTAAPETPAPLPRLLKDVAPRYPIIALNRRIEGRVRVSFSIAADGSVTGARVVSSEPARVFDQAALTAVSQWRFEATGTSVTTTRTLNFNLDGKG